MTWEWVRWSDPRWYSDGTRIPWWRVFILASSGFTLTGWLGAIYYARGYVCVSGPMWRGRPVFRFRAWTAGVA